jgi:hypothetical protein
MLAERMLDYKNDFFQITDHLVASHFTDKATTANMSSELSLALKFKFAQTIVTTCLLVHLKTNCEYYVKYLKLR